MDKDNLIVSVIMLGVGVAISISGFKMFLRKRLIENIPSSKIRSLAMGLVEIYGKVALFQENVLISPLWGKRCIYYSYKVQRKIRDRKGRESWHTIKRGSEGVRFYLSDDTGAVLVDPAKAEVSLKRSSVYPNISIGLKGITVSSLPANLSSFNSRFSIGGFFGAGDMRYIESVIEPDDMLYILGTAGDNPLVEDGTAQQGVQDVMIQRGETEKTYLISDQDEKDLLKSTTWKMAVALILGPAIIIWSAVSILTYFGLF